ncbi:MAG TPA: glyceraldehyde 3-phosphate dehydrogenase NAD-binding domain-containing protein [Patescibacteria group bacterium]|uniref:Glyceraldehyde 3-phosphate dehydrogenase NAD(P) binding domain-containing protein n=1 Tax=Candidatus Woesebacteria bacterium RBG_13_46_13 TaxID=1802479 RepID=A0A1F7X329_9BACT|nr:MAG: hypothetical protein A2Y68_00210 [Candidatus Woesebacteria bacterium RBG_13_46_13]HJX58991.1 glyceraldehyde 3-phosphate dehydrogenase NAD-binding domain-containing protein [Patescibacteria group bacterium]
MNKLRIGINGFGRIGRAIYRINHLKHLFDIVAINDINPDNHNIAYLLQYDSTYGKFPEKVRDDKKHLMIGGKKIYVYHQDNISDVPWDKHGVDIVIESSGVRTNLDNLDKLRDKIKNVIATYDPGNIAKSIILGVNEKSVNPSTNFLFSASICDAVALAPIVDIILKSNNIVSGFLTTIHPWLSYQNLLDGPSKSWTHPGDVFSHYALGRSSVSNIIPKSTSAVQATEKVIPKLNNKIISFSFRSPTNIVSGAVLTLLLKKPTTYNRFVSIFKRSEKKQKYNILKNSVEPLTSIDYIGEEYSAIIDHRWTKVNNKRHVELVYWYDNEWGYGNKVIELISLIGKRYKSR